MTEGTDVKTCCLIVLLALTGCNYPIHRYDRATASAAGANATSTNIDTVDKAKQLLNGWKSQLDKAANQRQYTSLVASEILYYGTLLMVGGSTAMASTTSSDPIHIRNIGAGLGLGATLFSNRYRIDDQRQVFEKTLVRLGCAEDALSNISDATMAQAMNANIQRPPLEDGRLFSSVYDDIPTQLTHFIERQTVPDLQAALRKVTLASASSEELSRIVTQFNEARTKADIKAQGAVDTAAGVGFKARLSGGGLGASPQVVPDEATKAQIRRFLRDVPAFQPALELCRSTHQI